MKIKLLCVGRVKEKYFTDAINEYVKRLSKFTAVEIIEVPDEMTKDKASAAENLTVLKKEGDRLLSKIKDSDYVISLEIEGRKLSSVELAGTISNICLKASTICLVIGGSLGLDDRIKKRSDFHLSFSDLTFPHQLMRVIVLEQLYRAFKINNNEPYHK